MLVATSNASARRYRIGNTVIRPPYRIHLQVILHACRAPRGRRGESRPSGHQWQFCGNLDDANTLSRSFYGPYELVLADCELNAVCAVIADA